MSLVRVFKILLKIAPKWPFGGREKWPIQAMPKYMSVFTLGLPWGVLVLRFFARNQHNSLTSLKYGERPKTCYF